MDVAELTEDDFEAVLEVRNRSFGVLSGDRRDQWTDLRRRQVAEGRGLVVRDAGRAVAAAHYTTFTQWWQGRSVDMAGVGSVVVAPEYRGRGVGSLLMRAMLDRMLEHGHPVSMLFPATLPPYRKVGYELAGQQHFVSMPTAVLRSLAGRGTELPTLTRAVPADAQRVKDTLDDLYRDTRECGSITWPVHEYDLGLNDEEQFDYLAADGSLCYRWSGEDIHVDWAVGGSTDTVRALWAQVGSYASIAKTVTACVPPDDPLFWLLPDTGPVPTASTYWWMQRLLDAPGAIAGRGFPPSTEVDAVVEVTDAELPANTGTWRLTVGQGKGALEPYEGTRRDPLHLDRRGLAALYAGTSTASLRRSGLASGGDPGTDAALDAAFHGTTTCRDHF